MTHTEQRAVGSISLLALIVVAVATGFASSAAAFAATAATRPKHRCPGHTSHKRPGHASLRRSASRARQRHRRVRHRRVRGCERARETTAPSAPANLNAALGGTRVALSWGASTGSFPVAGYRVNRNGGRVAQTANTSFTDVALTNANTYSYYVVAYDTAGHVSRPSNTVSVTPTSGTAAGTDGGPQTTWNAVGTPPLSDAQAAALVTHKPEQRPANVAANNYVPSPAELQSFYTAVNQSGQTAVQETPLNIYVDGLDGMTSPSTDDLIQWGAHKWGIPEDWLRAEYVLESYWGQAVLGDRARVSASWYTQYPSQARLGGNEVFETMGITGVKWKPDNSVGGGTEQLRWRSTAFNIDYQAASVRYYYDGYCSWCTSGYSSGQQWNSIGAWYEPYPWVNTGAQSYIASVQKILSEKPWLSSSF
jgi:hypothetical protein